jgi:protein phosphatase
LPKTGGIKQLTQDHTHVGWQLFRGDINERESRTHLGRNALQQALGGSTQSLHPSLGAIRFEAGDAFLLCTDGLVEGLWNSGIERLVRKKEGTNGNTAERLVEEAVQTDGLDNTTALFFEIKNDSSINA